MPYSPVKSRAEQPAAHGDQKLSGNNVQAVGKMNALQAGLQEKCSPLPDRAGQGQKKNKKGVLRFK